MDDLISREAAIEAIRASAQKYTGFMEMEMYTDDDAVKAIEALPTAEKVGKWMKAEKGGEWWYACSICSSHIPKTLFGQDWHSSYCPNCGARMSEGEEG